MNEKYPYKVGQAGRWMIFAGVPSIGMAVVTCAQDSLNHSVGQRAFPYVVVGIVGLSFVLSMAVYHRLPKWLIIPIGIIGWILTFSLVCWYFWFGPGALRI